MGKKKIVALPCAAHIHLPGLWLVGFRNFWLTLSTVTTNDRQRPPRAIVTSFSFTS
jgi:hypothetical protein